MYVCIIIVFHYIKDFMKTCLSDLGRHPVKLNLEIKIISQITGSCIYLTKAVWECEVTMVYVTVLFCHNAILHLN